MTLGCGDLADTLEMLARLLREPPAAPVGPNDKAYKDALLTVAQGGVRALQRGLGITADGIAGNDTRGALDKAEVGALVDAIGAPSLPPPPANPKSGLTDELRAEYKVLFDSAETRPVYEQQVNEITRRVSAAEHRLDVVDVSLQTGVPARVICIMQALEANLDFDCHLHNGDPLSQRTKNVPAGRPLAGQPPFSWAASALDALFYHDLHQWHDWSIEGCAYVFERYNGWGYRLYHPTVPSPYLWSFSTVYSSGRYVADGKWDAKAVSAQCGAMTMLKALGGV